LKFQKKFLLSSRHSVPEEAHADASPEDDERAGGRRAAQPAEGNEHQRQRGHHDRVQPQLRVWRRNLHPTRFERNSKGQFEAYQVSSLFQTCLTPYHA
jgi:hypothetical protein